MFFCLCLGWVFSLVLWLCFWFLVVFVVGGFLTFGNYNESSLMSSTLPLDA